MRLVVPFLLLSLPASALAQIPVRMEHHGDGWVHADLVVGWHAEPYREVEYRAHYVYEHTAWRDVPDTVSLCTAPCMTALPNEPSRLVLRDETGSLITSSFVASPGATLVLSMDRHGALRGFGQLTHWLGLIGTVVGGCFSGLDALFDALDANDPGYHSFLTGDVELGGWIGTAASAVLWLMVGLPFMSAGDGAHVEVIPGGVRF